MLSKIKKTIANTTTLFLIVLIVFVCIIVIVSFFIQSTVNMSLFFDIQELAELGTIGDFFAGHLNGFILLSLIVSLYYQRTSIDQTNIAIKEQQNANETMKNELKESVKSNDLQVKEFITTNSFNEINHEADRIYELESIIGIDKIIKSEFSNPTIVDTRKFLELFERLDYLNDFVNDTEPNLRHKLEKKARLLKQKKYTELNLKLLKRVFIYNELLNVYQQYTKFIGNTENLHFDSINNINLKYLFLHQHKKYSESNKEFILFEKFDCMPFITNIEHPNLICVKEGELWKHLFDKNSIQVYESDIDNSFEYFIEFYN